MSAEDVHKKLRSLSSKIGRAVQNSGSELTNDPVVLKFVLIGDLHLKAREPMSKREVFDMTEMKLLALKEAARCAMLEEADFFCILGDVFDSKEPPDWLRAKFIETLRDILEFRRSLSGQPIHVIVLVGNHDTDFSQHSMMSLQTLVAVTSDVPLNVFSVPHQQLLHGVHLTYAPYSPVEHIHEALQVTIDKHTNILLGHLDINGAKTGPNHVNLRAKFNTSDFLAYDAVFLGHVHKRQIIPYSNTHIEYIGSPLQMDFSERNDPQKGYTLVTVRKSGKVESNFQGLLGLVNFTQIDINAENINEDQTAGLLTVVNEGSLILKVVFSGDYDFLHGEEVNEMMGKVKKLEDGVVVRVILQHVPTNEPLEQEEQEEDTSIESDLNLLCTQSEKPKLLPIGEEILAVAQTEVRAEDDSETP